MRTILLAAFLELAVSVAGCVNNGIHVSPEILDRVDVQAAKLEASGDQAAAEDLRALSKAARSPQGVDPMTWATLCARLGLAGEIFGTMGDSHAAGLFWNISGTHTSYRLEFRPHEVPEDPGHPENTRWDADPPTP